MDHLQVNTIPRSKATSFAQMQRTHSGVWSTMYAAKRIEAVLYWCSSAIALALDFACAAVVPVGRSMSLISPVAWLSMKIVKVNALAAMIDSPVLLLVSS